MAHAVEGARQHVPPERVRAQPMLGARRRQRPPASCTGSYGAHQWIVSATKTQAPTIAAPMTTGSVAQSGRRASDSGAGRHGHEVRPLPTRTRGSTTA